MADTVETTKEPEEEVGVDLTTLLPTIEEPEPLEKADSDVDGKPKEESKAEPKDDPRLASLAKDLADLKIQLAHKDARAAVLEETLQRLRQEEEQIEAPPPVEESVDDKEIIELLRSNPVKAIKLISETTAKNVAAKLRTETQQEIQQANQAVDLKNSDRQRTFKEYGDLLESDQDFRVLADKMYDEITANNSGKWIPNALFLACSAAAATLARSGKSIVRGGKVKQEVETKPSLREKTKPPRTMVTSDNNGSPVGEEGWPEDFSPQDIAKVKGYCDKFKISPQTYIKEFNKQRKMNPAYGSGS